MLKDLYNWMIHWAATPFAVPALFFISFAESSFFPLPPDLLLIPMCLANPENSFWYALVCTVGSVLGGVFGLGIGRYGGRPLLKKLVNQKRIDWAEHLYQKYDAWAIGIAGFTPIPYKVFTILAGALHIRVWVLVVVSIISRGGRFFLVATLIYFYGEYANAFIEKYFNLLTIGFIILLVGGFVIMKVFSKRHQANLLKNDSASLD